MGKISIDLKSGEIKHNKKIIVGIDLGTTNSLIAVSDNKKTYVLSNEDGSELLVPSIIHIDPSNQIFIGEKAKAHLIDKASSTLYSVKRLMGKSFQEVENKHSQLAFAITADQTSSIVKIKINEKYYTPTELSAYILKYLKNRAERILKCSIEQAVITVPAYFNDQQRQATRDAGKVAGLDVLRIINEPTAASLAYGIGLRVDEIKHVAVYDLGGGTFDISILRIENGIFDVLSTAGDTQLGGDDFDNAILSYWISKNQILAPSTAEEKNKWRLIAEEAKKHLSQYESYVDENTKVALSIEELKAVCQSLIQRTFDACKKAVLDSGIKLKEIDEVLLVGGSTKMPIIKAAVFDFFKIKPNDSLNPDEVVALGAAIQADILAGNRPELLLLDVTPLSLGIETLGGLMDVIIPRNNKVPVHYIKQYTTSKDAQVNLSIAVYQGERELVQDNRLLAKFILTNIPSMPAGIPKIEIHFDINADGILKVSAKELRSGQEQSIEIRSQYAISAEEMAKLLKDSVKYAEQDMRIKSLIEIQNESDHILLNAKRFLSQHEHQLTEIEITLIQKLVNSIINAKTTSDKDLIENSIETFNQETKEIAHRIMDISIQDTLTGQKILP